jgi:hypothetical protein
MDMILDGQETKLKKRDRCFVFDLVRKEGIGK